MAYHKHVQNGQNTSIYSPKGVLYNSIDLDELNDIYQNVVPEYKKGTKFRMMEL